MPANTPNQSYPYPLDGDVVDVPADVEALAMAVDADVEAVEVDVAGKVSKSGDTMSGMLSLPGANPTSLNHAVRKGWADDTYLNKTGDTMSGDLLMAGNQVKGLGVPQEDNDATRKVYVDNLIDGCVVKSKTGQQTVQGPLHADAFVITDADEPSGPWHCAPKNYVDSAVAGVGGISMADADNRYVNVAPGGDTMNGALTIGGDWQSNESAIVLRPRGTVRSTVNDPADGPSIVLNRELGANDESQYYIQFNFSVDQDHGSIQIDPDRPSDEPPHVGGTGVKYNTTSDYRLKENFGPVADAAERVRTLARRVFHGSGKGAKRPYKDMLNAHDIAEVAPYAVTGEKDGPKMQQVDYSKLVPLLTAALGDALERIDCLEARLA